MNPGAERFDYLLVRLMDARLVDEDAHGRNSSLEERTASHDSLMTLRAEIASLRNDTGLEPMVTSGSNDSRTRRGIDID